MSSVLLPLSRHRWPACLALAVAAACMLGGCDKSVLCVPRTHMIAQPTAQTYEFAAQPQAVWDALLAEMAAEGGQKPLAQDTADRMGSWTMYIKEVENWSDIACEGTDARDHKENREAQGLTTAWVDAGPGGNGSSMYLVRTFFADGTHELVINSQGYFERKIVAGMRKRLGEAEPSATAAKGGNQ
jgi:hypothetical protein